MTQQVQELINKIKTEGIQEAENKAQAMEEHARQKAKEIVSRAEKKADALISEAKAENEKFKESTKMALRQVARDAVLTLRKEMEEILTKIVSHDVGEALAPEQLANIIGDMVNDYIKQGSEVSEIAVTVSPEDLTKLNDGFIGKLKKKIKEPILFQTEEDISAGFTISFDGGKSCFDFSDKSLVEYLSRYLNEEVSALLKSSVVS